MKRIKMVKSSQMRNQSVAKKRQFPIERWLCEIPDIKWKKRKSINL